MAIVCDGVGDVKESPLSPTPVVVGGILAEICFTLKDLTHIIRKLFIQLRG
jgi:hypothetical protein